MQNHHARCRCRTVRLQLYVFHASRQPRPFTPGGGDSNCAQFCTDQPALVYCTCWHDIFLRACASNSWMKRKDLACPELHQLSHTSHTAGIRVGAGTVTNAGHESGWNVWTGAWAPDGRLCCRDGVQVPSHLAGRGSSHFTICPNDQLGLLRGCSALPKGSGGVR